MALRFRFLPTTTHLPKPTKFHTHTHPLPSNSTSLLPITNPSKSQISCSNTDNRIRDLELALDFARKVEKLNTELEHKRDAVKKSRQILVTELCNYFDVGTNEFKSKWVELNEDDKLGLVKGFVSEWGADFHPLSAKSVKEMVDEYCVDNRSLSPISSPSVLFSGLKKILGFESKE